MKIKRIEPIAVSFPMKKPVFMAGVEIRQADNVLVRIESDNGVVGWGEAASAPTMTGETVESMMAAVAYLMPAVEGRPAEDIAGALRGHERPDVRQQRRQGRDRDGAARPRRPRHRPPAYALLGGKRRSRMAILGVISNGELASDLREAASKKAEGYTAFKIKVGIDKPLVDGERTRRVCAAARARRADLRPTPIRAGARRRRCNTFARSRKRASTSSSSPCTPTTSPAWRRWRAAAPTDRDRRRREHPHARGHPPPSRAQARRAG